MIDYFTLSYKQLTQFGYLGCEGGLLSETSSVLGKVFMPALRSTSQWGKLNEAQEGKKIRKNFLDTYSNFLHFLAGMHSSNIEVKLY